jgi:histidinol-phosphate aminotransferase
MTDLQNRPSVRPAVQVMKPYVPGTPLETVRRELGIAGIVKMNQNENPLGPSAKAVEAAAAALAETNVYPESSSRALREVLAKRWHIPSDWLLIGNGSDEVFRLLAEAYLEPADAVVVPSPSFAGYPLVAELMGARVLRVPLVSNTMDLPGMARIAAEQRARMIFLCRPNSPTGAVFPEQELRRLLASTSQETLVVLDEAYRDFDETAFDSRALVLEHPNLVVTRTFSKIYGMAGFRLGYGIARLEILEPLHRARDPFSVNSLAIAAGIAALADPEHVDRSKALVREGKTFLYALFERLAIEYVLSEANFVLFHTKRSAADVYDALLRKGILIRPCTSFGLPHSIRVTVGTPEQNRLFAAALEQVL